MDGKDGSKDKSENGKKSEKKTTSRPKDVQHHKQWLQVLLSSKAAQAKDKSQNNSSAKKSEHRESLFSLKSQRKKLCHSLSNLADVEEEKTSLGKKISRTLDNRHSNVPNLKSGSADDILDKITNGSDSSLSVDEDTYVEEDGDEENSDKSSFIKEDLGFGSPKSPEYCLPIDQIVFSSNAIDKEERIKNLSHTDENSLYVDLSEESNAESNLLKPNAGESSKSKYNNKRISETKLGQIREGKFKTRNFFGKREPKRSDESSTIDKNSKKEKNSESTLVNNYEPRAKTKGKLKSKYEQVSKRFTFPKDEVLLEDSRRDHKQQLESSNDPIGKEENLPSPQDSRSSTNSNVKKLEEISPKKKKNWRGNPKSNESGHQTVEFRNTKLTKNDDIQLDEGKKRKKKISFLSKMLKSKRNEYFEERDEEEKRSVIENYIPTESNSQFDEKSPPEEGNPSVVIHKVNLIPMAYPITALNDELKKKLQSRVKQLHVEENPSSEMTVSPKSLEKPPIPMPKLRNEAIYKASIPVIIHPESNKQEEWKPSLPPRTLTKCSNSSNGDNPSRNNYSLFESTIPFDESYSRRIDERLTTYPKDDHTTQVQKRNDYDHVQFTGRNDRPNVAHSPDVEQHTKLLVQQIFSGWDEKHQEDRLVSGFSDGKESLFPEKNLTPISTVGKNTGFISVVNSRNSPLSDKFDCSVDAEVPSNKSACDDIHGNLQIALPLERSTNRIQRIDELGLLLNELDRINSSPLENVSNDTNSRPVSEEIKGVSIFSEDVLAAFPIRRRRNSDPDYDIPRPHRLPQTLTIDSGSNDESHSSNEIEQHDDNSDMQDTDSIAIKATCFFGPGMDYRFNENRYFCLNENIYEKDKKYDVQSTAMDYSPYSYNSERDNNRLKEEINGCTDISLNADTNIEEKPQVSLVEIVETRAADEGDEEKIHDGDNSSVMVNDENGVVLRVKKVDRCFRHDRSREVCEHDIVGIPGLAASMEDLLVSRTIQEEVGKFKDDESDVVRRQKPASESGDFRRDNKTLRLSFATTETLIVEEEVLVATLKTTTTTTTTSPSSTRGVQTKTVEEFTDEIVLDMDNLPEDYFGSMEVQSCVQT